MDVVSLGEVIVDSEKVEVVINDLHIDDPQLFSSLSSLKEDERKEFIKRAVCIGSVVIQMLDTTSRVDYVRSEFERIRDDFCSELDKFLAEGGILPSQIDKVLGKDGELAQTLEDHFGEEGSVIYKILNPNDETTPLGKFSKQLKDELDANKEGTAFYSMRKCVEDGINRLSGEISEAKGRSEEREKGTAKGRDFQDFIYESLDEMAKDFEDTVEFVGDTDGPMGKVGDVLIQINSRDTRGLERRIIVEAKNAPVSMSGKKSFLQELEDAKQNRVAQYAIGAVHESKTPASVGALRRYDGQKTVCRIPEDDYPLSLELAYKVARGEIVQAQLHEELDVDPRLLLEKLAELKSQIEKMRAVKSALSGAEDKIDEALVELGKMEKGIKKGLKELTNIIKAG